MDLRIFFSTVSYSVRWRNKCGLRSSKKISNKQQQQQRWNICVFKIAASGQLMGLYKCDISFLLLFYGRWKAPTPSRTNRILYQYEYLFWIFKLTICLVGLSNRYVLHEQAILRHCTSHSALCDTFHTTHTTHDTHTFSYTHITSTNICPLFHSLEIFDRRIWQILSSTHIPSVQRWWSTKRNDSIRIWSRSRLDRLLIGLLIHTHTTIRNLRICNILSKMWRCYIFFLLLLLPRRFA